MKGKWKYEGYSMETPASAYNYTWTKGIMRMLIGDLKQTGDGVGWGVEVTTDDGDVLLAETLPTKTKAFEIGRKFRAKH
jgi:hypothetical protein